MLCVWDTTKKKNNPCCWLSLCPHKHVGGGVKQSAYLMPWSKGESLSDGKSLVCPRRRDAGTPGPGVVNADAPGTAGSVPIPAHTTNTRVEEIRPSLPDPYVSLFGRACNTVRGPEPRRTFSSLLLWAKAHTGPSVVILQTPDSSRPWARLGRDQYATQGSGSCSIHHWLSVTYLQERPKKHTTINDPRRKEGKAETPPKMWANSSTGGLALCNNMV